MASHDKTAGKKKKNIKDKMRKKRNKSSFTIKKKKDSILKQGKAKEGKREEGCQERMKVEQLKARNEKNNDRYKKQLVSESWLQTAQERTE